MKAKSLKIREILATNSQKTIEIELESGKGRVRSSAPMGTSKSKYEIKYFQTPEAIRKFLLLRRTFTNQEYADQSDLDNALRILDKTPDFKEIGGNVALAISTVFLKAFALENNQEIYEYLASIAKKKISIPKPISNVVGGWKQSGYGDIQEYLLLPVHQNSFFESIEKISVAYRTIGQRLKDNDPTFAFAKNIEGGWVTNLNIEEILQIISKVAVESLLKVGLDVAASHLWDGHANYVYTFSNKILNRHEQKDFLRQLAKKYPIAYIEDPFNEDDFVTHAVLNLELQPRIICGDDLYSTNSARIKDGADFKATSAVIIKPSQVGTVTDVINAAETAKKNKMLTVFSHRSGETEDTLICHLAVGLSGDYIKIGISGDRTVKINEMIRIEENIFGNKY